MTPFIDRPTEAGDAKLRVHRSASQGSLRPVVVVRSWREKRVRWFVAVSCSVALIAACGGDIPTAQHAVTAGPARRDWSSTATSPDDPDINPNDTWVQQTQQVAETTTVTATDEPFDDPVTGAPTYSTTVTTQPQTVNVNAGYGYDGQLRVTSGFEPEDNDQTVWLREVGDYNTDRLLGGDSAPALDVEPIADLGDITYAPIDASGGGGSGSCIDPTTCVNAYSRVPGPQASRSPAAGPTVSRSITSLSSEERRVTESWTEAPVRLSPRRRGSLVDVGASTTHRVIRTYRKENGEWVLANAAWETVVDGPHGHIRSVLSSTITSREFHRNAELDAKRIARQAQASATSGSVSPRGGPSLTMIQDTTTTSGGGGGGTTTTGGTSPDLTYVYASADIEMPLGSYGPTLVLQHGFFSSSDTWRPLFAQAVAGAVVARRVTAKTLDWTRHYEEQAGALHDRLYDSSDVGPDGAVLIGHSNGGMVSRFLGRNPYYRNDYSTSIPDADIRGVITIGTPNWGAPLAKHARSVNRLLGWGGSAALLLCAYTNTAGCVDFWALSNSSLANFYRGFLSSDPVLDEMQPQDEYHSAFNGAPESFKRFGITSIVWHKWELWREWGDAKCMPLDTSCGGSAKVRHVDKIYHHDISCSIISGILANWGHAAKCAADAVFLRAADDLYQHWVVADGDVVVPAWSQKYPNIPSTDNYVIPDGPAHTGETKDQRVVSYTNNILLNRMGYTPK